MAALGGTAVFPGVWLVADSGGMTGAGDRPGQGVGAGRRWDVALSFAGAQRDYVRQVAAALKARGVRCFYDADKQIELWGTHLAEELPRIYAQESAAVVVFFSADYAGADWTRLERRAAFSRAVAEAGVYVLPARFDDSDLPGLLPDVVTVDLRRYTPEQFAGLVADKVAELASSPPGGPQARAGPARSRWRCTGRSCPKTRNLTCRHCRRTCRASMTNCWPRWCRRPLGAEAASRCWSVGPPELVKSFV